MHKMQTHVNLLFFFVFSFFFLGFLNTTELRGLHSRFSKSKTFTYTYLHPTYITYAYEDASLILITIVYVGFVYLYLFGL